MSAAPAENDMPLGLNAHDKKWIKERIKEGNQALGIDERLGAIQASMEALRPPQSGGRRLANFLKNWGLTSAAIGAFLTLLVLSLTMVVNIVKDSSTNAEFRGSTTARVQAIETTLRELQAPSSPKKVLNQIGSLDKTQFDSSFSALKIVSAQSPETVSEDGNVIHQVAEKIVEANENAPDYWPATLQFASFATKSINIQTFNKQTSVTGIHLRDLYNDGASNGFGKSFDNKTLILDGGTLSGLTITGSRIIFTDEIVKFHNVRFVNCIFEFPADANPSYYLKQASKEILVSDFKSVFINSLG